MNDSYSVVSLSYSRDLALAPIGGMAASLLVLIHDIIPLPTYMVLILVTAGLIILYRGFLVIGRTYGLKWVTYGSNLMLTGLVFRWFFEITGWAGIGWLSCTIEWVGPCLIFVDIWPMRGQVNPRLVTGIVASQLIGRALIYTSVIPPERVASYEALAMGLIAWFLYDVASRLSKISSELKAI